MRKFSKKTLFLSLAILIGLLPIINCCLLESASADSIAYSNEVVKNEVNPSHSHGSQKTDTSETEECNWGQIAAILSINNYDILKPNRIFSFSLKNFIFSKIEISNIINNSNFLIGESPPQTALYSVPIYLQNSTLRI